MSLNLSQELEEYNEIIGLMSDIVTGVVDKGYINTLLISGTAGIGKSWTVDTILSERQEREVDPIRYTKYTGHVTPLALYEKMKENSSSDCVLVFDDADAILTNDDSVNIIKAASERTKRRRISWVTSSSRQENFDFEGKLIIITNIVLSKSPHLLAIKDRFHLFNMEVSYLQKLAKIEEIANSTTDKDQLKINREVINFLIQHRDNLNNETISIRTFKKLTEIATLLPHKWKRFIEVSGTYLEKSSNESIVAKRKYTKKTA